MNLSKNEKVLIIITCVLFFIYVYMNIYFDIMVKRINKSESDVQKIKQQIVQLYGMKNCSTDKKLIMDEYSKAEKAVPQSEGTTDFLYYIKSFDSSDIKINTVEMQKPQKMSYNNNLYKLSVKMQISGLYENMIKFINNVESGQRFVNIESLKVSDFSHKNVDADLVMNTYYTIDK